MARNIFIKDLLFVLLFIMLVVTSLFNVSSLGYFDEVLEIASAIYLAYALIKYNDKKIWVLLLLLLLICFGGLAGYFINSQGQVLFTDVLLDVFFFLKPYIIFMAAYLYLTSYKSNKMYSWLRICSVIVILILFLSCLVFLTNRSILSTDKGKFVFFAGFTGDIANIIIACCAICFLKNQKTNILFWTMSAFVMYFNGSGLGLLGLVVLFFFCIVLGKIRFRWYYLVFLIIIGVLVSWQEISGYLLNNHAPRNILFRYAFVTSNSMVPFGSGPGTYGTYISKNHYSYLYQLYGFNSIWGLSSDTGQFLYDAYYPMIIAQFGYFGTLLFLSFLIYLFQQLIFVKQKQHILFASSIALYIYIITMGLGFNISSISGCFLYCCLALIIQYVPEKENIYEIQTNIYTIAE